MTAAGEKDGRRHRGEPRQNSAVPIEELTDWPVLRRWLRDLDRRGLRPLTRAKYQSDVRTFGRWCHPRSIFELDRHDIEEFLDDRHIGDKAMYQWLSVLSGLYAWAIEEEITVANPPARLRRPKMRRAIPRPIAADDLLKALAEAPPDIKAMLALGAWQGLRAGEIAGLKRQDVLDTHNPPLLVVADGKGGHQRILPLNEDVLSTLRVHGLPQGNGYLFVQPSGAAMQNWKVSQALNHYFDDLGIEATAHMLRHYFGTKIYAATHDIRVTQELMGHQSPNTTAGYVAWSPIDAAAAVRGLTRPEKPHEGDQ